MKASSVAIFEAISRICQTAVYSQSLPKGVAVEFTAWMLKNVLMLKRPSFRNCWVVIITTGSCKF